MFAEALANRFSREKKCEIVVGDLLRAAISAMGSTRDEREGNVSVAGLIAKVLQ